MALLAGVRVLGDQRLAAAALPFREEAGWVGHFTRGQASGALPNGTRIVKTRSEPGDGTPDGTPGVVLGSFSHPAIQDGAIMYFLEWASKPRVAVGAIHWKVREMA